MSFRAQYARRKPTRQMDKALSHEQGDSANGGPNAPADMIVAGDLLFKTQDGVSLWKSGGTPSGTTLVNQLLLDGTLSDVADMIDVGGPPVVKCKKQLHVFYAEFLQPPDPPPELAAPETNKQCGCTLSGHLERVVLASTRQVLTWIQKSQAVSIVTQYDQIRVHCSEKQDPERFSDTATVIDADERRDERSAYEQLERTREEKRPQKRGPDAKRREEQRIAQMNPKASVHALFALAKELEYDGSQYSHQQE